MAYEGQSVPIPLGELGLRVDTPMTSLPPNALIQAFNVSLYSGRIEKSKGTAKYNDVSLESPLVCVYDWWPLPTLQRLIAITADGKVWRDSGDRTFNSGVPIGDIGTTITVDSHIVSGGQEESGKSKKLFLLTGERQVKIIDGDSSAIRNIANPSPDWANGNFPTYGCIYQGRMCLWGSSADPHRVYMSQLDDHENFGAKAFSSGGWEYWEIRATTTNQTSSIQQTGNQRVFFTTTNNYGIMIGAGTAFDKVTFTIDAANSGGVYQYSYWNGSVWSNFTPTSSPDYTTTGVKTLTFTKPLQWVRGSGGQANDGLFFVRILATTAPSGNIGGSSFTVSNESAPSSLPPTFSVYPGEGEGILTGTVYRGVLILFKRPFGVYVLDGTDPDTSNWSVKSYSPTFGVDSPHSVVQVLSDLIAANSFGSYTSLQASDAYGDFEAGDILANNLIESYVRSLFNPAGIRYAQCSYYPEKRVAYFTGQSSSEDTRNLMLCLDVSRLNALRISIDNKERPNCIAMRKDFQSILRPIYGDKDGFVWMMEQDNYIRGDSPYNGEFQTAYTDMSFVSPELGGKNKIFDFLEINYIAIGNNPFYCDVFIDGEYRQTITFTQKYGAALDSFVLDVDRLTGDPSGARDRKPLKSCTGNRISFKIYNNSYNESFSIERIIISFRVSAEQLYSYQK